jgi:ATP-dependent helicase/nuclease subunit A
MSAATLQPESGRSALTSAQALAIDTGQSVWTSASAGSGKTHVLTSRVLRLLVEGADPAAILCLTFTKAAAAEMKARILKQLGLWARADEAQLRAALAVLKVPVTAARLAYARGLFAAALDAPGGLQVMTLHAFAQSLLARFPLEAGLTPGVDLLDDAGLHGLATEALHSELSRAYGLNMAAQQADFERLGLASAKGGLRKMAEQLAVALEPWVESGQLSAPAIEPRLRRLLGLPLDPTPEAWLEDKLAALPWQPEALQRFTRAWATGSTRDLERCDQIAPALDPDCGAPARLKALTKAFATRHGGHFTQKVARAFPDLVSAAADLEVRLQPIDEGYRLLRVAVRAAAVLRAGLAVSQRLAQDKARLGVLNFNDQIRRAAALLTDSEAAAWVRYKLDQRIDHVLVDEAQDNSPGQWDMVKALVDDFFSGEAARDVKRTLFVVGDFKQSIYSFQGAAPDRFAAEQAQLMAQAQAAGADFAAVPLDQSFRSTPAVLAAVDATFAEMAQGAGPGVVVEPHAASRQNHAGRVTLWPLVTVEADQQAAAFDGMALQRRWRPAGEQLLAQRIAQTVQEWLAQGRIIAGLGRAVRAGDILILVRKRGDLARALVANLKAQQVPVAGLDRMTLTEAAAVQDLLAALSFAVQPEDDLTLACLLTSPLLGWCQEALFALAHPRGKSQSLWSALRDSAAHSAQAAQAVAWLGQLLAIADWARPYEVLGQLLSTLGGRVKLRARLGGEADVSIDVLLGQALRYEAEGPPSLQGFLAWIDRAAGDVKREAETRSAEVRVMTVHGAKGLEAPIVILADAQGVLDEQETFVDLVDPHTGLALPVLASRHEDRVGPLAAVHQAQIDSAWREYYRLLYVGMTRAADELYVGGWQPKQPKHPDRHWWTKVQAGLNRLNAVEVEDARWGTTLVYRSGVAQPAKGDVPAVSAEALPLPAWAVLPPVAEPKPPKPLAPSRLGPADPPGHAPGGSQAARDRGVLLHRLLEALPAIAMDRRDSALATALPRLAPQLSTGERAQVAAEALGVVNHPGWAEIFGPGSLAEAPITAVLGAQVLSGQIDRLLVTPQRVLILDFKSGSAIPARPEDAPAAYVAQMAAYRAALAHLYPDRPIEAALLWTAGPLLMPLPATLMDALFPVKVR